MMDKKDRAEPHLTPVDDLARRDAIISAISDFPLHDSAAWSDLDALSSNTQVDAIEANTEGIFAVGNNKFEATATVYVILTYGDKKDRFSITESFPAHVSGKIGEGNKIEIADFSVDTSSFYDDGQEEEDETT